MRATYWHVNVWCAELVTADLDHFIRWDIDYVVTEEINKLSNNKVTTITWISVYLTLGIEQRAYLIHQFVFVQKWEKELYNLHKQQKLNISSWVIYCLMLHVSQGIAKPLECGWNDWNSTIADQFVKEVIRNETNNIIGQTITISAMHMQFQPNSLGSQAREITDTISLWFNCQKEW